MVIEPSDSSERIYAVLLEILRWTRVSSYASIKKLLEQEFMKGSQLDEVKARIYDMSDGVATSVSIAKHVKVSQSFVSRSWGRWRQLGIAEPSGEGGRQTRRCFSLDDFGLRVDATEEES